MVKPNYSPIGSIGTVSIIDNISGDTLALAYTANSNTATANYCNAINFFITNGPINATNYYASGHIQFDIMLGPAYSSLYPIVVAYGQGAVCTSSPIPGLSQSAFTHVSIPLQGGFNGCNETGTVVIMFIGITEANIPVGIQFYIDDVQWTPN